MASLSEEIAKLVELSMNPQFTSEITDEDVKKAKGYAGINGHSTYEFFVILSAINLLNAAVKLPEYKHQLNYGFIKGKVKRLMVHMVNQHIESIDIKFFINAKESCAYFEIYDLQFSFHNLYIPYSLGEFVDSEYNIIRPWKQVRLQRIAGELFRLSLRGRRH